MELEEILFNYFGYKNFRNGQRELIQKIIDKNDVIAVLPTGFGKSLIYQIAGLKMNGLVLVISPLIALMKDQVMHLKRSGIKAEMISSEQTILQELEIYKKINTYKFLYVSPERLLNREFKKNVCNISMIVIDEAHTLKWGLDFRKAMYDISIFVDKLKERPVITAFTATATNNTLKLIANILKLKNPYVYKISPVLDNIEYIFLKKDREKELKNIIEKMKNYKIIVYSLTRILTEKLYDKFKDNYLCSYYHGGLDSNTRRKNQDAFSNGSANIMFATNAFGMGIDIKDIRAVIIYDLPLSLSDLVQQVGRAGRDRKKSYGFVMVSNEAMNNAKYLIARDNNSNKKKDFDIVTKFCYTRNKNKFLNKYFNN